MNYPAIYEITLPDGRVCSGNVSELTKQLYMSSTTVYRYVKEYFLDGDTTHFAHVSFRYDDPQVAVYRQRKFDEDQFLIFNEADAFLGHAVRNSTFRYHFRSSSRKLPRERAGYPCTKPLYKVSVFYGYDYYGTVHDLFELEDSDFASKAMHALLGNPQDPVTDCVQLPIFHAESQTVYSRDGKTWYHPLAFSETMQIPQGYFKFLTDFKTEARSNVLFDLDGKVVTYPYDIPCRVPR